MPRGDTDSSRPEGQSLARLRSQAYDAGSEIEDPDALKHHYLRAWEKRCELALLILRLLRNGHFLAAEGMIQRSSDLLADLRLSQTEREQHNDFVRVLGTSSRFDPDTMAGTVETIQGLLDVLRNRRDLVRLDLDAWHAFKADRKMLRTRVAENARTLSSVRWQLNLTAIDQAMQHRLTALVDDPRHSTAARLKAAQELTARYWSVELPDAMRAAASRIQWLHALESLEQSYESFVLRGSAQPLKESIAAWQNLEADYSVRELPHDLTERRDAVLKKVGQLEQTLRDAVEAFARSEKLAAFSKNISSFATAKILRDKLRQIDDSCSRLAIEPSPSLLRNLASVRTNLAIFRRRRHLKILLLTVVTLGVVGLIILPLVLQ